MVYRTIIGVIFHLFIIFQDWWCNFPFFKKTFHYNVSAILGEMCHSASLVTWMVNTNLKAQKLWSRHLSFLWIKFIWTNTAGGTSDKIRCPFGRWSILIGVCLLEFLCSGSDSRYSEPQGEAVHSLLPTRRAIYWYRKIHINYRSKFSYRFISSISIIYGNNNNKCLHQTSLKKNHSHHNS